MEAQGKYYEPFEGWLGKLGEKSLVNTWRKRFFSLQENELIYFENDPVTHPEERKSPKGKIPLKDAKNIRTSTESFTPPGKGFFQIELPNRVYYLQAPSDELMQRWMWFINYSKELYSHSSHPTTNSNPSAPPLTPHEHVETRKRTSLLRYPHAALSEKDLKQFLFTEGNSLKDYVEQYKYCCKIIYTQQTQPLEQQYQHNKNNFYEQANYIHPQGPVVVEGTPNQPRMLVLNQTEIDLRKRILCIYLGLKMIDWDTRDSFNYCYAQSQISQANDHMKAMMQTSSPYEFSIFIAYFNQAIEVVQEKLLTLCPITGATIITQVNVWVRRQRNSEHILLLRGDLESIIKWNLSLLFYMKNMFLALDENAQSQHPEYRLLAEIEDIITVTVDMLYQQLTTVPTNYLPNQLWNSLDITKIDDQQKPVVKSFLEASLLFQKLKLENDKIGFSKRDPYLTNKFENVLSEFTRCKAQTKPLLVFQQDLRTLEMKMFAMWNNDITLLQCSNVENPPTDANSLAIQQYTILLKNYRMLKRIAAKLNGQFPSLENALFLAAIAAEERLPKLEKAPSQVPFPDSGESLLAELIASLHL